MRVEEARKVVEAFEKGVAVSLEQLAQARRLLALRALLKEFVEFVDCKVNDEMIDGFLNERFG